MLACRPQVRSLSPVTTLDLWSYQRMRRHARLHLDVVLINSGGLTATLCYVNLVRSLNLRASGGARFLELGRGPEFMKHFIKQNFFLKFTCIFEKKGGPSTPCTPCDAASAQSY